jgi:hypothetical protein
MSEHCSTPTLPAASQYPPQGFVRNRLQYFGLTMVVMGASFILYYLGLFGTVEGPLTPANMGATLSEMGVTQRHVIVVLLSLLVAAVIWNWVFNLTSLAMGHRMTCKALPKGADSHCGAPVKRTRYISKRTGRTVVNFVCPCGHRRTEAHFHPVKKGTAGNTVWVACLILVIIALFGA